MRRIITLSILAALLVSCSSVKRNEKFLAQGNYDQAIEFAVKKLQKNNKRSEAHIVMLEEAYVKVVERDTRKINFLKKQGAGSEKELYYLLLELDNRQNYLRPLLPLYSESLGRNINIALVDYSNEIITARENYAAALYEEATYLMGLNRKHDYRKAYGVLTELERVSSNYRDARSLKEDAHYYGTDFVYVTLNNRTNVIIPRPLEQDLLNFNTYGLNDFWTEYHSNRNAQVDYDYGIALNFRSIQISPEQIFEEKIVRVKRIKDGWRYKLDRNGDYVLDSLGNRIKIDNYIKVRAVVTVTEQSKAVAVGGNVTYRDLIRRQDIDNHPLASEFVFENVFARYRGDDRALTEEDLALLENRFIPFPSNAQMVLDAGEDIKYRLKNILKGNSLP